jgi:hypothetical protein
LDFLFDPILPCLISDGLQSRIVEGGAKRTEARVVVHLGVDTIAQNDHAGFLLGIDPQRAAREGQVPNRASGNQRSCQ